MFRLLLALLFLGGRSWSQETTPEPPRQGNREITERLKPILLKHDLPALGAAIIHAPGEITTGVVGVRRAGGNDPVTLEDLWHIGSCGKAMHATLMGKLVELGKIRWETRVEEVFPKLAPSLKGGLGKVTLEQLLSHHGGLERDANYRQLSGSGTPVEQRLRALKWAGSRELVHRPGTRYSYSNLGYVISGAILEKVTGRPYEESMRAWLFLPMKMTSAVFESPGVARKKNVPWSHDKRGRPVKESSPGRYDPPSLRPAGCIRCTLRDWGKFILHHLLGEEGKSGYLKAGTYRRLHTPLYGGEYALGWMVLQRDWGGGTVLQHTGSNTVNYANVWIAPRRGFAILVCTNRPSFEATDEAVAALIDLQHGWHPSKASGEN